MDTRFGPHTHAAAEQQQHHQRWITIYVHSERNYLLFANKTIVSLLLVLVDGIYHRQCLDTLYTTTTISLFFMFALLSSMIFKRKEYSWKSHPFTELLAPNEFLLALKCRHSVRNRMYMKLETSSFVSTSFHDNISFAFYYQNTTHRNWKFHINKHLLSKWNFAIYFIFMRFCVESVDICIHCTLLNARIYSYFMRIFFLHMIFIYYYAK